VIFTAVGLPKVLSDANWVRMFSGWGYPHWMLIAVGLSEMIGGWALLHPKTAKYGAAVLAVMMLGACYTHIAAQDGGAMRPVIPLLLIGATAGLGIWRDSYGSRSAAPRYEESAADRREISVRPS